MSSFITTAIDKHINMSKLHIINDEYITTMAEKYAPKYVGTKEGATLFIKWLRAKDAYYFGYKQAIADLVEISGDNFGQ